MADSFDPAQTVKKLLDCAERRAVHFLAAIQQSKMQPKLLVQRLRIVANNLQTAALAWPFRSEGLTITFPPGFTALVTWRT
jgi:hypothetical protein